MPPHLIRRTDGSGLGRASVGEHCPAGAILFSAPALCTTCDQRLDDTSVRACAVRDCPHAQKEAA